VSGSAPVRCAIAMVAGLMAVPNPIVAQASRPVVIAILPFEDRGSYGQDKEVSQALELGIPATIASELRGHPELRLADSDRLARALNALKIGPGARIDAATAGRIAKAAGARYAITGGFADFYGRFRLDVRIVDAESGQILKVVSNKDPKLQNRDDLYRIVQSLGHEVLAVASPSLNQGQPLEPEPRVIPTEALTHYSLGLLYERQDERAKAAQHYTQALSAFPDYPEAREGARRVRGF
jgi:TolB-like protein